MSNRFEDLKCSLYQSRFRNSQQKSLYRSNEHHIYSTNHSNYKTHHAIDHQKEVAHLHSHQLRQYSTNTHFTQKKQRNTKMSNTELLSYNQA